MNNNKIKLKQIKYVRYEYWVYTKYEYDIAI